MFFWVFKDASDFYPDVFSLLNFQIDCHSTCPKSGYLVCTQTSNHSTRRLEHQRNHETIAHVKQPTGWLIWLIFLQWWDLMRFVFLWPGVFSEKPAGSLQSSLEKKKHVYKQHSEFIFHVFFGTNELVALFLANWNKMQVLHIFSRIHLPHLFTSTRWSFTQRICPWYSAMSAENMDQHNVRWKMWYLRGDIV